MIPRPFAALQIIIIALGMAWSVQGTGQSTSGIPGYIRIPSANLKPDGTIYTGSSFLPHKYLEYTQYRYDAATLFASVTFLPFLEIDFRFTRQLGLPSYDTHVSDRMPSIRVRLLREKKWYPTVTAGVHDFLTSLESGKARHFQSSYLVLSKTIDIPGTGLRSEATIGYGTNWLVAQNVDLIGFFGGLTLNWHQVPWITLMADHDGKVFSTGIEAVFFRHLYVKAGITGFDSFTGCISYHVFLKNK